MNKDHLKNLWEDCVAPNSADGFIDGLVLGTIVNMEGKQAIPMFHGWKQSAEEMGFTDIKKKIVIYSALMMTYYKGKNFEFPDSKSPTKKRELKSILKQKDFNSGKFH
jgi:hypothetical protein